MVIRGEMSKSWPRTLVFFRLMVSPKSLQAWENLSMRHWSCCSVMEVTAPSSAKSMSLMRVTRTFVFALSLSRFNNCPSDLVCRYTPSVEVPKTCFSSGERRRRRGWTQGHSQLFHTTIDVEWLRHTALILDGCLHIIVEGPAWSCCVVLGT